jgi:hypothetical protein
MGCRSSSDDLLAAIQSDLASRTGKTIEEVRKREWSLRIAKPTGRGGVPERDCIFRLRERRRSCWRLLWSFFSWCRLCFLLRCCCCFCCCCRWGALEAAPDSGSWLTTRELKEAGIPDWISTMQQLSPRPRLANLSFPDEGKAVPDEIHVCVTVNDIPREVLRSVRDLLANGERYDTFKVVKGSFARQHGEQSRYLSRLWFFTDMYVTAVSSEG